jgi:hypothetical protein
LTPRPFNDRLVQGVKGTVSEADRHLRGARLLDGRLSKAHRGETPDAPRRSGDTNCPMIYSS